MTPADFRALIAICGLSNRESAAALGIDDRLIRRLKSGEETASSAVADRLIALAADALAAQMLRSLELAAGGKVELAALRLRENVISVDSILSAPVAAAIRGAILKRLDHAGLKVEFGR